jgi:Holliday junction resolvasome RuvABC endonuclease subunit
MTVAGLDPSLSGTALAHQSGASIVVDEWRTKFDNNTVEARNERYAEILRPMREILKARPVDVLVIEGHPFGAVDGKAFDRAELRGQIMLVLKPYVGCWVEIAPHHLKQFVTGKGNASKTEVEQAITRRWGRGFDSDNQADAYGLLQIGLVLHRLRRAGGHLQDRVPAVVAEELNAAKQRAKAKERQLMLGGHR